MASAAFKVTLFADPGCEYAFSAEPVRRKLAWTFGDQFDWTLRMLVLADDAAEWERKELTPEKLVGHTRALAAEHHMPLRTITQERIAITAPACLAIVAAREHDPATAFRLMRELQQLGHSEGEMIDLPEVIELAAGRAGIDPEELAGWVDRPATKDALNEDKRISREPLEEAMAIEDKLGGWSGGTRYSSPTYVFEREGEGAAVVPGFWAYDVYELVLANLAPQLEKREPAASVIDVLRWADSPLAAAEVAAVCAIELDDARDQLAQVAAGRPLVGCAEEYWSLGGGSA